MTISKCAVKKSTKKSTKKLPKNSTPLHYVRVNKNNYFSARENPALKSKRIDEINYNILKVWITRFIMLGNKTEDWGITEEDTEIVAWFTYEYEATQCERLFNEIKKQGFPMHRNWNIDTTFA
jgi:hypothetical protein